MNDNLTLRRRAARIERLLEEDKMRWEAERYVAVCAEEGQFPNLAGFARRMRVGVELLTEAGEQYPEAYDAFLAVLEDGALNATCQPVKSATLAVDYFRHHLGYRADGAGKSERPTELQLVFEHDMTEDGK